MIPADIWAWIWTIGGPFVSVCIAVWAFYFRKIYTAGAYEEMKKTLTDFYTDQIQQERKRHEESIREERARSKQYFGIIQDTVIVSRGVVGKLQETERSGRDG